jgi:hypothetical protein
VRWRCQPNQQTKGLDGREALLDDLLGLHAGRLGGRGSHVIGADQWRQGRDIRIGTLAGLDP